MGSGSPTVAGLYVLITGTGRDDTDAVSATEGEGGVGCDGNGSSSDGSMMSADALAVFGHTGEGSEIDTALLGDLARDTDMHVSADTQPESTQGGEVLVDGQPYCLISRNPTVRARIFVPTETCSAPSDGAGSTE